MVYYHAITSYQLINCIVHALLFNKETKRILILPSFIELKFPDYLKLKEFEIFNEIYLINYTKYNGKSKDFILNNIDKDFNEIMPNDIKEISDIYVGGAQYYFSCYLINHKIDFNVIEEGAGLISKMYLLKETIEKQKVLNVALLEEYGVLEANSPFIKKKICLLRAQDKEYQDDKLIDFDVVMSFQKLSTKEKNNIMKFFKCPSHIDEDKTSILLLTQNFANLNQLSFDDQILIYQIVFDFYFEDKKVIIKPHPDDIMYYEKLFPTAKIIREKFPSELLPYIFNEVPETISTISSTGVHLIEPLFNNKIVFDVTFEKQFRNVEKYFVALQITKYLNIGDIDRINCNDKIIENLILVQNNLYDFTPKKILKALFVGNVNDEEIEFEKYDIVIFLNLDETYSFTNYYSMSEVFSIRIKKKKLREKDNYYSIKTENIYVYGKEIESQLKDFEFRKRLKYCGIELEIEKATDKDIYIMSLEGQVRALEKRLLYYINKDKEKEE